MKSFNQFIAEAKKLKREPQAIVTEVPEIPFNEENHPVTVADASKAAQQRRNKEAELRKQQDKLRRERERKAEQNRKKLQTPSKLVQKLKNMKKLPSVKKVVTNQINKVDKKVTSTAKKVGSDLANKIANKVF